MAEHAGPGHDPHQTARRAPLQEGVTANSIVISAPCGYSYLLPDRFLGRDESVTYREADAPVICDYQGYVQPDVTRISVRVGDDPRRDFAIPTPNRPTAVASSIVTLDLSTRRGSGLCGSGFGSCDPPTTVFPGPQVVLLIEHLEGSVNHLDDWDRGSVFRPLTPPAVPTTLPERVQLDWFNSGVEALDQNGLAVNAEFDRPVTLTARLSGADDDPCLAGTVLERTVAEPRTAHSFRVWRAVPAQRICCGSHCHRRNRGRHRVRHQQTRRGVGVARTRLYRGMAGALLRGRVVAAGRRLLPAVLLGLGFRRTV